MGEHIFYLQRVETRGLPVADSQDDATHQYVERSLHGPCFVCAILEGTPGYPHHDVYEDDDVIAFFVRRPTMLGHTIVAPKRHVESWVEDLTESEFLAFQRHVRRIAVAISAESQLSGCTR